MTFKPWRFHPIFDNEQYITFFFLKMYYIFTCNSQGNERSLRVKVSITMHNFPYQQQLLGLPQELEPSERDQDMF